MKVEIKSGILTLVFLVLLAMPMVYATDCVGTWIADGNCGDIEVENCLPEAYFSYVDEIFYQCSVIDEECQENETATCDYEIPPDANITIISPINDTYENINWTWANISLDANATACDVILNGGEPIALTTLDNLYWYKNISVTAGQNNVAFNCTYPSMNMSSSDTVYFRVKNNCVGTSVQACSSMGRIVCLDHYDVNTGTQCSLDVEFGVTCESLGAECILPPISYCLGDQTDDCTAFANWECVGHYDVDSGIQCYNTSGVPFQYNCDDIGDTCIPIADANITIESPTNTTYFQDWIMANVSTDSPVQECDYSLDGEGYLILSNLTNQSWYKNISTAYGQHNITYSCLFFSEQYNDTDAVYFTLSTTTTSTTVYTPTADVIARPYIDATVLFGIIMVLGAVFLAYVKT